MPLVSDRPENPPCVLLTGVTDPLGADLAHRFIGDGYRVIAQHHGDTEGTRTLEGRGAHLIDAAFDSRAAAQDVVRRVEALAPTLRAIVHSAACFAHTADNLTQACAQFQRFFDDHMLAPFVVDTRLAARLSGSDDAPADIIHIGNVMADNPEPRFDLYCATQAGRQTLALSFAKRLAPRIKVNVVQLGLIAGDDSLLTDTEQAVLARTPLARRGTVDAVYGAVRAIMANDFQTGAVIPVDGGLRLGKD